MAGCSRSDPTGLAQMWLTLALSILQVIPTHLDKAEAQTPDIVHNELMQLMEEIALKSDFAGQGLNLEEKNIVGIPTNIKNSPLKPWQGELNFDPPLQDFGEVAIGMPQIETVRVFNPHEQNYLRMVSISGTTPHFHCSFFQEKVIPAGGNTSFEIVFLPRVPGNVENTIFIHSNKGSAPYQVFGIGVPNPYRLRPILGARVPLNTSFSPIINMHNPYSSGLMVTEMYSSGGDLHLELPTGSQEAPQNLWEIPPYQTRSVMRASFTGRVEHNHTAFIRIKTNYSSSPGLEDGELLMLPVEVEVSSAPGLYSSLEMIDFGTLRSLDEPKSIQVYLLNTSPKSVQVTSVSLVRTNQAVSIDFKPVEMPSTHKYKNVANITFYPLKANYSRFWSGKIIIKTKDKNIKLQIPYQAHVLPGTLSVFRNSTHFHLLDPPHRQSDERTLHLTNYFNFSIVIHQASLLNNPQGTFEIKNFSGPIVIPPHKTDSSLTLAYTPSDTLSSLSSVLRLGTNASLFTIPIHAYTGKLKFFMNGQEVSDKINLGTTGLEDHRVNIIVAVNDNPVEVPITLLKCTLPECDVVIIDVQEGNTTYIGEEFIERSFEMMRYSRRIIPAFHYAVMFLRVTTPPTEGTHSGIVQVETPHHVTLFDTVLKTVEGFLTIKPETVVFPPTYPGLVQTQSISVLNSFSHKMTLESLKPLLPDDQFYFKPPKKNVNVEIEASKKQKIGKIVFDVRKNCRSDCYVGLPTYTPDGQMWLSSLTLDEDPQDIDRPFFNFRRGKWLKLQKAGLTNISNTMRLTTNLVKDVEIPVLAELKWPKLAAKDIVKFPMTLVDSAVKNMVTIVNPTESTIIVQLLPITAYKNPSIILDLLSDRFDTELVNLKDDNPFSVRDIGKKDCRGSCMKTHLLAIEDTYGIKPDPGTCAMAIKSKQNATVSINFRPYDNKDRVSLIVIRNNLTIVDGFLVQGMGAKGELKLSNKLPGANSNIVFDMKVHHLNDCDRSSPKARSPPHFTVKRTLTLKNTGQIALHIHSWYINGLQCEGYGFRVLQCDSLFIQPNSTARLDITFCPDFSLARVVRTLQIQLANKELLEYNLIASLPHHLLSTCASAVPRPTWEYAMYSICVGLMCFFLVVIFTVAYLEAVRFMEPLPSKHHHGAAGAADHGPRTADPSTWKKLDFRTISGGRCRSEDPAGRVKNGFHCPDEIGADVDAGGGGNSKGTSNQKNGVLGNYNRQRTSSLNNNKHQDPRHAETKMHHLPRDKMKINDLHNGSSTSNNYRSSSGSRRDKHSPTTGEVPFEADINQEHQTARQPANRGKRRHTAETAYGHQESAVRQSASVVGREPDEGAAEPRQPDDKSPPDQQPPPPQEQRARGKRRPKLNGVDRPLEKEMTGSGFKAARIEETRDAIVDSDDVSSTTTEGSTGDSEHAERGRRQPVHQLDDFSWPGKDRTANKVDPIESEVDGEDSTFEDVRSRSRRKNLLRTADLNKPCALELPYTTPLEAGRRRYHLTSVLSSKEPTSPHSLAARATAKATRAMKPKSNDSDTTSTASSERDKDSPPPLWDLPKPVPSQHPVAHPKRASSNAPGNPVPSSRANATPPARGSGGGKQKTPSSGDKRNDDVGGSGKDKPNSYSSVVSGSSAEAANKKPQLSKTNSDPGKKTSAFTAVHSKTPSTGGGHSDSKPTKSTPWTPREMDSSSDTSSGTSTGPSSPGVFTTPRTVTEQQGPATLRGPSGIQPQYTQYQNDDLNIGVWSPGQQRVHTSSSLPYHSKQFDPKPGPSTASKALISGDDWPGFGVSKAPTNNSVWTPTSGPPGFPPTPTSSINAPPMQWHPTPGSPPSSQSGFGGATSHSNAIWNRGNTSGGGINNPPPPMHRLGAGWTNPSANNLFPDSIWSSPDSSGGSLLDTSVGPGASNGGGTVGNHDNEESPASSFGFFSNTIWSNPSSTGGGWSPWAGPRRNLDL